MGDTVDNVTLADLRGIVALGERYRFNGDEWDTCDATITRRGREYPIGTVTVYDDPARGILVMRHHTLTTVAQRDAWNRITDMFGMARPKPWQTPYTMAPAISH